MREPTSVREEIGQSRPFKTASQEAFVALARTADVVQRFVGQALSDHGLTLQQYNVLRILRGAGQGGLRTLEIGERLIQPTPGITRLIDRLERKDLVRRVRTESDRRCVFCSLTVEGRALVDGLDDVVDRVDEEVMRGLDESELARLIGLLDQLRAGLPL